jgi:hypothetical protein
VVIAAIVTAASTVAPADSAMVLALRMELPLVVRESGLRGFRGKIIT